MTNSATRARLVSAVRRFVTPTAILAASSVLVLAGGIAALTDHVTLTLVTVLLLQGCIVLLTLTQHIAVVRFEERLARRIDQASARQLADLARTRHAVLSAASDGEPEGPR